MNLKKFALCVISMFIAVLFANTGVAFAEDSLETKEIVIAGGVSVVNGIDASGNEIIASGVAPVTEEFTEVKFGEAADEDLDNKDLVKEGSETRKAKSGKKTRGAKGASYTKAELRLMSTIIYCEAGNQSYAGKLAVGIVVMNRKESRSFPSSIKSVLYQRSQFSPTRNGSLNRALARYDAGKFNTKAEKQCIKAAKEALNGAKSVVYNRKTINMKNIKYFSGRLRGAKFRIDGHSFK